MKQTPITVLVIPVSGQPYLSMMVADLAGLQKAVGGYVQRLPFGPESSMYLNEDGKMMGLAVNETATSLISIYHPGFDQEDFIVGPALVVGDRDGQGRNDGEDHNVPGSAIELCAAGGFPVAPLNAPRANTDD